MLQMGKRHCLTEIKQCDTGSHSEDMKEWVSDPKTLSFLQYVHLDRATSWPETSWDPSTLTPCGSWPPASAAGYFLQLPWRSRAGVYIQGVSFFSFPTCSGLWGPLDPRSQSWVYTQKFLLIWLCLCENFQMRLIHFLSLLFFLIPWNDTSSCTLSFWR